MTKPKTTAECPICGKALWHVSKHLRVIHALKNVRERGILNGLATGRTAVPPGPCPFTGCSPYLLHVEKHLRAHSASYTRARVDREIKALKRTAATVPAGNRGVRGPPGPPRGSPGCHAVCRTRRRRRRTPGSQSPGGSDPPAPDTAHPLAEPPLQGPGQGLQVSLFSRGEVQEDL